MTELRSPKPVRVPGTASAAPDATAPPAAEVPAHGRGLAWAAGVTAGLSAVGSVGGLVRDQAIAHLFGAGAESDAFLVAWTVPEIAATVLIEDAMALLMVPAFSAALARAGGSGARGLVRGTLPRLLALLAALTAALAAGAPYVVDVLAPGLADPRAAVACTRLTALTVLSFGLTGYLSAALRAHRRFVPPAAVYVAYNAGIVATLLTLHGRYGVRAAAAGVAIGGLCMVAVQLPTFVRVLAATAGTAPGPEADADARTAAWDALPPHTGPGGSTPARPGSDPDTRGEAGGGDPAGAGPGGGVPAQPGAGTDTRAGARGGDLAPPAAGGGDPAPAAPGSGLPARTEAGSGVPGVLARPGVDGDLPAPAGPGGGLPAQPGSGTGVGARSRGGRGGPAQPQEPGAVLGPARGRRRVLRRGGRAARRVGRSSGAGGSALAFGLVAPVVTFTLGRQAQVLVERFFAAPLAAGAISHLNYAQKVAQLPMALSLMIATVTFPVVSRALADGDREQARRRVTRDLRLACLVVLLGTAYVIACAPQITDVLFQRGEFTASDTTATAGVMRVYALGLLGQTLVGALVRPYFSAARPTWFPAACMGLGLLVTAVADAAATGPWGAYGIAAGNAAGISVTAVLLLRGLAARGIDVRARDLAPGLARTVLAAAAATAAGWALTAAAGSPLAAAALCALAVPAVFAAAAAALRAPEVPYLLGRFAPGRRSSGPASGQLRRRPRFPRLPVRPAPPPPLATRAARVLRAAPRSVRAATRAFAGALRKDRR